VAASLQFEDDMTSMAQLSARLNAAAAAAADGDGDGDGAVAACVVSNAMLMATT